MFEGENFAGNNITRQAFLSPSSEGDLHMKRRKVDREKIDRADRVSRVVIDAERLARDQKTARLREQRLKQATERLLSELNAPDQLKSV